MSLLVRAPLRQLAARRAAAPVRNMSGHGEYKHIPFEYKKKGIFGAKVASYLIVGFSIPFIASYYQLSKSGGGSD